MRLGMVNWKGRNTGKEGEIWQRSSLKGIRVIGLAI